MASTTNRLMTFAEFERMTDSDRRYELRHGELVKLPPPELPHYQIQRRLRRLLEPAALEAAKIDIEFAFRALPEYEYRIADVAFISRDRWERLRYGRYFEGVPDIVIEVLSPSNTSAEMRDKEHLCLSSGAKEFWIVDGKRKLVTVSAANGATVEYKYDQEIPLLFGGAVRVDEIFQD
ncbi:MAG TPA: Uma2 family endonuclease [Bryobacteraceae bacterium]|nr:Uma2 family endonuclease [Bryobacteraceae bacterium]